MQFNTYTYAGAHIAAWLVNHPAPVAREIVETLHHYDVHEPAATAAQMRVLRPWVQRLREVFEAGTVTEKAQRADELLAWFDLTEAANKVAKNYSGGMRRRLDLAASLVGRPQVIFLDEPTTGLDPQARRHLWDLVDRLRSAGRTIILTTHYMDEAEHLCDRVAIMDHGRIIALGTPQQLIASIGGEHVVEFAIAPHDAANPIDARPLTAIPGVRSHRVDAGLHQLSVVELHTTVPHIFATLAEMDLKPTEFRTHSATLEDVFVGLTGRNLRDE